MPPGSTVSGLGVAIRHVKFRPWVHLFSCFCRVVPWLAPLGLSLGFIVVYGASVGYVRAGVFCDWICVITFVDYGMVFEPVVFFGSFVCAFVGVEVGVVCDRSAGVGEGDPVMV